MTLIFFEAESKLVDPYVNSPLFLVFIVVDIVFVFFKFHICLVPVSGSSASLGVSTITAEYQHILN